MSAFCFLWFPTHPSKADTGRQWWMGWLLKLSQLPNRPSNNSQLWREMPVRFPDEAELQQPPQSLRGGGRLREQSLSPRTGFVWVRTDARMFQKKTSASGESVGKGSLYIRDVFFNCKCRATHRVTLSYC